MSRITSRFAPRAAIAGLAVLAMIAVAGCSDEEQSEQSLTFSVAKQSKEAALSAPAGADAGLTEITLENKADREAELQLIRVDGDHPSEEVFKALGEVSAGKPFPDWLLFAGGVGPTGPRQSQTVSQVLAPGTYYAVDPESGAALDAKNVPAMEVSGEESDEEVEAGPTVTAVDYGFEAEDLHSGEVKIDFQNAGAQPHQIIASKAKGDAGAKDFEEFLKTGKGESPLQIEGTQATAILEGGEEQAVTFDLKPGRYVLYCYVSDREGGPPHVFKGMVDEVEVK